MAAAFCLCYSGIEEYRRKYYLMIRLKSYSRN